MATYKFLIDWKRCIKCTGCEVACKQQNDVPKGVRRIRVVGLDEGKLGEEKMVPMSCFHCNDPPCVKVCPTTALYKRADGIVLTNKDKCIGCGYCLYACPFGAPQFPGGAVFGGRGKMDKCTFCVEPFVQKDGAGKLIQREPKARCAAFCATKALLAGDQAEISKKYRERVAAKISPLSGF
jgi:formate dehydrogenase iron-sulfur subunit